MKNNKQTNTRPPLPSQVRDYSGTYAVRLLPCTAPLHQEYRLPVTCNPGEPVTFDLDIRFQQVRRWLCRDPWTPALLGVCSRSSFTKDAHRDPPSRARGNRSGGGRGRPEGELPPTRRRLRV